MQTTDSADGDTEYETVEVTDDEIERFLDCEVIDLGEYTWCNRLRSDTVGYLLSGVQTVEELRDGDKEMIRWPEHGFAITYDPDDTDSDTMEFTEPDDTHRGDDMATIDDRDRQHVTMEVTMDISDMDPEDREVICALARQYEDSFQEVVSKNRDYSWSFLTTGSKLAASEGTPFDSPVRSIAYGLLTRSGDKRERLIENIYGDGSQEVSDSPATTAREAANYYQFLAFVLANPQLAGSASDV